MRVCNCKVILDWGCVRSGDLGSEGGELGLGFLN